MKCDENVGCPIGDTIRCGDCILDIDACPLHPSIFPLLRAIIADDWSCWNCGWKVTDTQLITGQRKEFCDLYDFLFEFHAVACANWKPIPDKEDA